MLCWLCIAAGAQGETFMARVIAVPDGDTVTVLHGNRKTSIRLLGIDAPEIKQPWGSESRASLIKLVLRKDVRATTRAVDDYGRVVATLEVGGTPGIPLVNVNQEQLRRGMAWADPFHHSDPHWMAMQKQAQQARLGLWHQANPQPPWAYRRGEGRATSEPPQVTPKGNACGSKRYCSQMVSCEEARFYLSACGLSRLDRDGNGVPCESLCSGKRH